MSAGTGPISDASTSLHPVPGPPLGTHSVQFYEEDCSLIDSLTKLVGTALIAGDTAIVVATQAHHNALAERLQARGLDLEMNAKLGRYCALDAAETLFAFMVNGSPDAARFHAFMGYLLSSAQPAAKDNSPRPVSPRLVLFGEMVALLWAEGNIDAAIQLEQLWNELGRTHAFDLHCGYPMKSFAREAHNQAFLNICAEHSHVVPTKSLP